MKIDLVITRHPSLLQYLEELGLVSKDAQVLSHADADTVTGKNVCGVLPHSLSCLCETFTEVPLNLPPGLRGTELSLDQLRQYAGNPVTYKVTRV